MARNFSLRKEEEKRYRNTKYLGTGNVDNRAYKQTILYYKLQFKIFFNELASITIKDLNAFLILLNNI